MIETPFEKINILVVIQAIFRHRRAYEEGLQNIELSYDLSSDK